MSKYKQESTATETPEDDILVKRLKEKEVELEEMRRKEEKAKEKEKAQKPMINKTNKMILCAVIFGLLVIACMAIPAGSGLAAVAIATAGVGAYGLATAVKGGIKSFKRDPIKEAKKEVMDERIRKITEGLGKDNDGDEAQESNTQGNAAKMNSGSVQDIVKELLMKNQLKVIQDKILKNAKEVLGEDFQITDGARAEKALFEDDNFEKFIANLSNGLNGDSRNIRPSNLDANKGQGELFKEFVKAYETLGEDKFSEKKLRLEGLKDIFKDWNTPASDAIAESKKEAAKNMLNNKKGANNDGILKPAIDKAEEKVKSTAQTQAQAKASTRSPSQTTGGQSV